MTKYTEREITAPVNLCDGAGGLNPAARGWSRTPLHSCNLRGRRLRKKRWNYWCVLDDRFAFSATLADIDYLGLAAVYFLDFEKKLLLEKTLPLPPGAGPALGERVAETVALKNKNIAISMKQGDGAVGIQVETAPIRGKKISADIRIAIPPGHETLNVVIPWNSRTFQFTSKQNCLPASGTVRVGGETYEFDSRGAFGALDFGRGIWPYKTAWNWGAFSQRRDGRVAGVNLGGKWTDGTGANENSITLDGRLHKVMEDLVWEYDTSDFMKPWRVRTAHSDMIDLTLTPFFDKTTGFNAIFLGTRVHQCFGRFSGFLNAGGDRIPVDAVGWAEESVSKW